MSKRLANRRENKPRRSAFVPRAILACAGAGAAVSVIPVCVAGMAGCTLNSHVDPAFNDYLDASDGGSGDGGTRDVSTGSDVVSPDAPSDAGPSNDAALPDDAASDVVSPDAAEAGLDGAKDASGVDP
jgi:hypothetical protein